ncbi:hypothetical protein FIC_02101 [Flavobacteriaceae bacterium 3519-10]|nr:hypothetical protein FIC_02101 [Flavobacteriaceae bacterium 3519-10]
MNTKETKINYFSLIKRLYKSSKQEENEEMYFQEVFENLRKIKSLSKFNRTYDLKGNKFCLLDNLTLNDKTCYGYFKSARNEFRPKLIDRKTLVERNNPKFKSEGDIEKTHFLIKQDSTGEVILFLEHNHFGITINNFINYVQTFSKSLDAKNNVPTRYKIVFAIIAKHNFLTELEHMQRAKLAEVYIDKQLLGNDALNFSEKIVQIKQDVKLTVKADLKSDLTKFGVDIFNKFNGKTDVGINRIRIYGVDENGNSSFVDTSFMGKVDFVNANLNEDTGETISGDFLNDLVNISENF